MNKCFTLLISASKNILVPHCDGDFDVGAREYALDDLGHNRPLEHIDSAANLGHIQSGQPVHFHIGTERVQRLGKRLVGRLVEGAVLGYKVDEHVLTLHSGTLDGKDFAYAQLVLYAVRIRRTLVTTVFFGVEHLTVDDGSHAAAPVEVCSDAVGNDGVGVVRCVSDIHFLLYVSHIASCDVVLHCNTPEWTYLDFG